MTRYDLAALATSQSASAPPIELEQALSGEP
jgi:hypothetical protein